METGNSTSASAEYLKPLAFLLSFSPFTSHFVTTPPACCWALQSRPLVTAPTSCWLQSHPSYSVGSLSPFSRIPAPGRVRAERSHSEGCFPHILLHRADVGSFYCSYTNSLTCSERKRKEREENTRT